MVQNRRAKWAVTMLVAAGVAFAAVGTTIAPWSEARAQGLKGKATAKGKAPNNNPPAVKKGDPLAAAKPASTATGTFHYKIKLRAFDGVPLAATFYPSRLETNAPVVLLVHERERSSKRRDWKKKLVRLTAAARAVTIAAGAQPMAPPALQAM